MLYGAILRSPHAHAMVKRVDTSAAEGIEGVSVVLSGSVVRHPFLRGLTPAANGSQLLDPHCRYEGEIVAAVAAPTPYRAWDGVRAIRVDYDVLSFVADEARALSPGVAQIHGEGNRVKAPDRYERGDVARGFAEADVVLEETYRTACELHTPMEAWLRCQMGRP